MRSSDLTIETSLQRNKGVALNLHDIYLLKVLIAWSNFSGLLVRYDKDISIAIVQARILLIMHQCIH